MIRTRLERLQKRLPLDVPEVTIHWREDGDPEPTPTPTHLVLRWPIEPEPPATKEAQHG